MRRNRPPLDDPPVKAVTTDFKPDIQAVPAPAPTLPTAEVLGVPLAVTDYEGVMDWMDATIRAPAADLPERGRRAPRDGRPGGRGDARGRRPRRHRPRRAAAGLGAAGARAIAMPRGSTGPTSWRATASGRQRRPARAMFLYGGRDDAALEQLCTRPRDALPRAGHRRRLLAALPPADRRRAPTPWSSRSTTSGADVVWVGHRPAQAGEVDGGDARACSTPPMLVGVGAAFDFHAGLVPQAPSWMQAVGLEWAVPARAGAAPAVAALRALQPALRRRLRPPVPPAPQGALTLSTHRRR